MSGQKAFTIPISAVFLGLILSVSTIGEVARAQVGNVAEGRQIDHPAWSFACAERDVSERIVPCDEPVWVYGEPCQISSGVQGITVPCESKYR